MKRALALILALVMVFALAGCGGGGGTSATEAPEETEAAAEETAAAEEEAEETAAAEEEAAEETAAAEEEAAEETAAAEEEAAEETAAAEEEAAEETAAAEEEASAEETAAAEEEAAEETAAAEEIATEEEEAVAEEPAEETAAAEEEAAEETAAAEEEAAEETEAAEEEPAAAEEEETTTLEEAPAEEAEADAEAEPAADANYDEVTIRAAHGAAETTSENLSFEKFKELVEEKSGGKVKVEIYPNQQMGGDREYTESVQQGNLEMGGPSSANAAPFAPALNAFETPFMVGDRETIYKALDSDAGQAILDSMEEVGLKGLGYYENGFRHLTTNKDIETLDDLKGLKIRVMENDIHLAIWTALGANPGPLAFGELYTALQQKSFDAQENPAELIYNTKFFEVQDHVYLTSHIYTPYVIYIGLDFWNSLNADTQALIQECMDESVAYCREISADNEQACFDNINASGVSKTYEVSDELHEAMVKACADAGIYDMVKEAAGGTYAEDLWAACDFTPPTAAE